MTSDTSKIKEQVEFYFSNSNYAKDRFLQETAIKNNKCVPITVLLTFERMKKLGTDVDEIKTALEGSDIVEVVGDSLKKIETQDYLEYRSDKELDKKFVHMEGFDKNATLDDLKELLGKYGAPVKILMRRFKDKSFTGSCFVEYLTVEEAKEALSLKIEATRSREEEEAPKRSKTDTEYIKIIPKTEYLETKPKVKDDANTRFIKKVKADFIPKMYTYSSEESLTIDEIKKLVPNTAFVDASKNILRMKYAEEWETRSFENDGKKIALTRMAEEQAQEYVNSIDIRKVPKKKK
ncbi:lupus La protein [Pancytospora epiphaga]|nr:lupus La protein [Pancytospora epiphaga]